MSTSIRRVSASRLAAFAATLLAAQALVAPAFAELVRGDLQLEPAFGPSEVVVTVTLGDGTTFERILAVDAFSASATYDTATGEANLQNLEGMVEDFALGALIDVTDLIVTAQPVMTVVSNPGTFTEDLTLDASALVTIGSSDPIPLAASTVVEATGDFDYDESAGTVSVRDVVATASVPIGAAELSAQITLQLSGVVDPVSCLVFYPRVLGPADSGTIELSPPPQCSPDPPPAFGGVGYFEGTLVTIEAVPQEGFVFDRWKLRGEDPVITTTIGSSDPHSAQAYFTIPQIAEATLGIRPVTGTPESRVIVTVLLPGDDGFRRTLSFEDFAADVLYDTVARELSLVELEASVEDLDVPVLQLTDIVVSADPLTTVVENPGRATDQVSLRVTAQASIGGGGPMPVSLSAVADLTGLFSYDLSQRRITLQNVNGGASTMLGELELIVEIILQLEGDADDTNCRSLALVAEPSQGGEVVALTPENCLGGYTPGTQVTVQASAAEGFVFDAWSDDASGTDSMTTVVIDDDPRATASFTSLNCFELETSTDPDAGGSILLQPEPNCSANSYLPGTEVLLTPMPATGFKFMYWMLDTDGFESPLVRVMDRDRHVRAKFIDSACYDVVVTIDPPGAGSVSTGPGIPCQNGGFRGFSFLPLTAQPGSSFSFSGWSGDASGSDPNTTIQMDGDQFVTATFTSPFEMLFLDSFESGTLGGWSSSRSGEGG